MKNCNENNNEYQYHGLLEILFEEADEKVHDKLVDVAHGTLVEGEGDMDHGEEPHQEGRDDTDDDEVEGDVICKQGEVPDRAGGEWVWDIQT